MKNEFVVKKQFAIAGDIYNVGDIVELEYADSKSLVDAGKIEVHVEEKHVNLEVDTKMIEDAIKKGFEAFAPKPGKEEKTMKFGDYLVGIARNTIDIEDKTINITTANQGANATTTFVETSGSDILAQSGIAARLNLVNLSGTNNVYRYNVVSSAGTAPVVVAESNATTPSQPVITTITLTLSKWVYSMIVTDEAMEDTGSLQQEVQSVVPEEFAKAIENAVINGGTNMTAIVGHAQTTSIAKESGQTNYTVVTENIDKMYSSVKRPSRSIWAMSRSVYTAIQGLEDSNGNRLFQGPNGLGAGFVGGNVYGTLKGLPIVISDYCQAIGTVGDIICGDFSKYKLAVKGNLSVAQSGHIYFMTSEQAFRFTQRMAGSPSGVKWTATDGTTISDFCTLADRK